MARTYLGPTIDVHCGGVDMRFPHYENDIAQSEGAHGKTPFANYWLHNGFVNIGNKKMFKSKGNFRTLREACPGSTDVHAYRYLVVSSQYRNPLSFMAEALDAARAAVRWLDGARVAIATALNGCGDAGGAPTALVAAAAASLKKFEAAIADNLSMPRAAAALFAVVKLAEQFTYK